MKKSFLSLLFTGISTYWKKFNNVDWSSPKNVLIALACILLPFIAWYYISTGFIVGLLMSVSILWLLEKSPYFIKYLVSKFPFAADLILSSLVVAMFGGFFGSGLTLGIGAVFTAIILSWGLQTFAEKFNREKKQRDYAKYYRTAR
jgi:hypothetical protein